jgi:hypothetical protein
MPKILTTDYMGDIGRSYLDEGSMTTMDGTCGNFLDLNYTTCFGGTSAATPLVAGAAGLILSANPSLQPTDVQRLLQDCADKIEDAGAAGADYSAVNGRSQNNTHGYGRLNAYEAVKIASADRDKGGRNGVDIFLRDNELDWGNTEKPSSYSFEPDRGTQGWWRSMDIVFDAPPFETVPPILDNSFFERLVSANDDPISGTLNKVYVRVRNRGYRAAATVTVKLQWVHAGATLPQLPEHYWDDFPGNRAEPSEWTILPSQPIFSLEYCGASVAGSAADAAQVVSFDFNAPVHDPSTRNHYCFAAIITSADDLMPAEELRDDPERLNMDYITKKYNNATHRNYSMLIQDATFGTEFNMYNPLPGPLTSKLEVSFKGPKIPVHFSDSSEGKLVYLKKNEKKLVILNIDPAGLKEPTEITIQQVTPGKQKGESKIWGGITYYIMPSSKKSPASKGKK